ncbi:hypothetical protein ANPL_02635 [Anaplasma platys]|uniref:Ribosome hibernation promoting factor n=1 Tax=Anaplasma platys TaxID=949 RepID=A0A858PYA3_9RICK|nr:ribosome-associated translation inhibitor RaiA [Anaplasma platys]QJC27593.1 hypothetical protein ANPL_02635 [Anaplasma platys]
MNIMITCKGYSATDAIKAHINSAFGAHVERYLSGNPAVNARVVLSKEGHLFTSCVSIYDESQHEFIKASEKAETVYKAVDSSLAHISSKLKKYKSERVDKYRENRVLKSSGSCKGYTFSPESIETEEDIENSPLIVEEEISLKRMSVSNAVMEMELLSVPALLFINSRTNKVNMIYMRDDYIVWVDPLNSTLPK